MLTSWIDSHTPSHLTLYGLVGDLTAEQADKLIRPMLELVMRLEDDLPALARPRTVQGWTVAYPSLPLTANHLVLYAFAGGLTGEQAQAARRPFHDLVDRVQAGEDVSKPAKRNQRKADRRRGGAR